MSILSAHKNPITLTKAFKDNIVSRTSITNFDSRSKIRAMNDTLIEELIGLREDQIAVEYASKLSNARGKNLDIIGENLGVPRLQATHAYVQSTELSLALYVSTGTFGDYNSNNDISIPSGSITISSIPNANELNTSIVYTNTEAILLPAASSTKYIAARATVIGETSNVGANVLRQHNFTDYVLSASSPLKVVNFYPILNGRDTETDDRYRNRLANHYNRIQQTNNIRMQLNALEVPGIVNSKVEPGYFGIGTAGVFALGAENEANGNLVSLLQDRLNSFITPGGKYLATSATEVFFDITMQVAPLRTLSATEQSKFISDINKVMLDYFRGVTFGNTVDLRTIVSLLQNKLSSLASFSDQNTGTRCFSEVYIRKGFVGAVSDDRETLLTNTYVLENDEFAKLGTLDIEII